MRTPFFSSVALLLMGPATAIAQLSPQDLQAFIQKAQRHGDSATPAVRAIEQALERKEFTQAGQLSAALLGAPDAEDESPQFNAYVKSQAYLYRGISDYSQHHDWSSAIPDITKSADIGNLRALRVLMENFAKFQKDKSAMGGYAPTEKEISHAFEVGADLMDQYALKSILDGTVRVDVTAEQKLYWKLMDLVEPGDRTDQVVELLSLKQKEGETKIASVLEKYGLIGTPFTSTAADVPGRDVFATVFDEHNLRAQFVSSLGAHFPRERTDADVAPTVMENFLGISTIIGELGYGNMYLLVPGTPQKRPKNVRMMSRDEIVRQIKAGDQLWIGCGPFSHTANVFRVDRDKDSIDFIDPSWEFWQPSHNSCITSLSFRPFRYGYQTPSVKLSEVIPMIQALGTFRTAEIMGLEGDVSEHLAASGGEACNIQGSGMIGRPMSAVGKSELTTFFHLIKTQALTGTGGLSLTVLKPGTMQYLGDVGMIVSSDAGDCIRSMSLTVRRSFVEGELAPFGRDIVKSFISDVLNRQSGERVSALVSEIWRPGRVDPAKIDGSVANELKVFGGELKNSEQTLEANHLRMENINSPSGADMLRISIW